MSLLNIVVEDDRALVSVDTEVGIAIESDPTGAQRRRLGLTGMERFAGSKLFVVPHANAVVALRGSSQLLLMLATNLCASAVATFDDLADCFVDAVETCHALLTSRFPSTSVHPEQSAHAVGWSDREQQMVVVAAKRKPGTDRYTLDDTAGQIVSPWPFTERAPSIVSRGQLLDLSREQIRRVRAMDPDVVLGGELLLVELTRDTLAMSRHAVAVDAAATPA